jgi:hypothetical protein
MVLVLRPLRGSDEVVYIAPDLEQEPVRAAYFDDPVPSQLSNMRSGALFREALMLKLRNGAGPFRSFGHIAVEPRTYQLVPLLMALKMDPVRLLISDDVGIGKTIELVLSYENSGIGLKLIDLPFSARLTWSTSGWESFTYVSIFLQ